MARPKVPLAERFWRKVLRLGPDECWPWLGYNTKNGVPMFLDDDRKVTPARRVAWRLTHPDARLASRDFVSRGFSCKDKTCMNPEHMKATGRKGSAKLREQRRSERVRQGEDVPGCGKLTAEDVRDIKASTLSQQELAKKFGVSDAHIWNILNLRRWKSVGDTPTRPAGGVRSRIRLTAPQVGRMRRAFAAGVERAELALRFGVSYATVLLVLKGYTWRDV